MSLPQRINVIKTITYDVGAIRRDARESGLELDTADDVLEFIEEWVDEDFGGLSGLVFQDENGEEL